MVDYGQEMLNVFSLNDHRGCCDLLRRSQWPRGLTRGSAVDFLLGLRVRIPPGAWKFLRSECCALSGTGLCVGPIYCATSPIECGVSNEGDRKAQYRQVITRNLVEKPWKQSLTRI